MDLSGVIKRLPQTAFTVRRYAPGTYANEGEFQSGATTDIPMTGVLTPSKMADVTLFLPEGNRQQANITLYTVAVLQDDTGVGQEADVILWQGGTYRVAFTKPWQGYGYFWSMATQFQEVEGG